MGLFFYGLVDLHDNLGSEIFIRSEAAKQGFPIEINGLENLPLSDLFGEVHDFVRPMAFEVKATDGKDVYDLIYNDYGGELITKHYRMLGSKLGLMNWNSLKFGESDEVDRLYEFTPYPIPCVQFVSGLLDKIPQVETIFSFDHNFENRFGCQDVSGSRNIVIRQIWKTISFGYQFPNLRIRYVPGRDLGS